MTVLGLILSFVLATTAFGQELPKHLIYQNPAEIGPNIPILGSSLFDKVFSVRDSNGYVTYNVPYPFSQIMKKLDEGAYTKISSSALPLSRSIQRPVDMSFHPFKFPRFLIGANSNNENISENIQSRIFIGYLEPKDQLEAISYNREAGRFEFQIVTNYSKPKSRKVYYVERSKCLTCHQGQTPIFSDVPWQDTSFNQLMNKLTSKARDGWQPEWSQRILQEGRTAEFDRDVRKANNLIQSNRIWVHACKSDDCRYRLVKLTLMRKLYFVSLTKEDKAFLGNLSQRLPIIDSRLVSTDFGLIKAFSENGMDLLKKQSALAQLVKNLNSLEGKKNPSFPRKLVEFPKMFSLDELFAPHALIDLRNLGKDEVVQALNELYEKKSLIYEEKVFDEDLFMYEVLNQLGNERALWYEDRMKPVKTPKKVFYNKVITIPVKKRELKILKKYCAQCHGTGSDYPPQFLVGSEEEVLTKIKSLNRKISYKLKNNLMPPIRPLREEFIQTGNRKIILNWLKEL